MDVDTMSIPYDAFPYGNEYAPLPPIPEPSDSVFGFTQTVRQSQTDTWVALRDSATSPGGKAWIVNLGAWRSPNNQPRNSLDVAALTVTIDVATQGGSDHFTVDWPKFGCAFSVHGAQLTVTVSATGLGSSFQMPILSAWLGIDSSGRKTQYSPTLNGGAVALGANLNANFDVPPRAYAFRVNPILQAEQWLTAQFDGSGGTLALDGPFTAPQDQSSRWAWLPLHPRATIVNLTDTSGAGFTGNLVWLIDSTG
jgi:hypothetical protein